MQRHRTLSRAVRPPSTQMAEEGGIDNADVSHSRAFQYLAELHTEGKLTQAQVGPLIGFGGVLIGVLGYDLGVGV